MNEKELMKALENRKRGTMIRVSYISEPPLTALARKSGYKVVKYTATTGRYGVKYSNIKRVIEKEAARTEPKKERASWWNWKVPNVLQEHKTNGTLYFSFATLSKHNNAEGFFRVTYPDGKTFSLGKKEVQDMNIVQPSYWNGEYPEVISVKLENILSISKKR